jgi:hypothetical protein
MSATWSSRVVLLGVVCLSPAGCGDAQLKTAVVRGKVTFNGKPVPNGTISFIPTAGPTATGEIQPDGSFTLTTYRKGDGAVLGRHTVVIVAMEDMSTRLPEARNPLPPPIVPEKYTSLATTDLRREVKDEVNDFAFDLVDDKKKGR